MSDEEILSFKLWGDYALYKKPWCNREQQSYLIPPKTSLLGMLGAILGYRREEYLEKLNFEDIKVGIKLLNVDGKELHGFNFMHGKKLDKITKRLTNPYRDPSNKGSLSPTRLEFVKNPEYRIFLHVKNKKTRNQLKSYLKDQKCVFPPYLGQVNLFANFGDYSESKLIQESIEYSDTAVPSEIIDASEITGRIYNERIPVKMNSDRSSPIFDSIAIVKDAPIKIKENKKYMKGETNEEERVVLF